MHARHLLLAIALTIATAWPAASGAWGREGHKIVAAIAWAHMSPNAQREAQRLLDTVEPGSTLESVASWADEIKGRETSHWHFMNYPKGDCRYRPAIECRDGNCLVAAITRQEQILADHRQSDAVRAQALMFVVHLAGDAAQPLHASEEWHGGNDYQVQFEGRGTNLHAVWDSGLIGADANGTPPTALDGLFAKMGADSSIRPTYRSLKNRLVEASTQLHIAAETDAIRWTEASCRIANQPGLFPGRRVDETYVAQWAPIADAQLIEGGVRLAAVLNAILGGR